MCVVVARGHGGDCGGDPSYRRLSRIPASCEGSKPKNKRGPSKGKNLEAAWKANGQRPLPVMFDKTHERTYSAIGDNGRMMNSLIGSLIRSLIPPYYLTWEDVPSEDKMQILPRVESFFDIGRNTLDWPAIDNGLNRYCANRYAGAKYRLHAHFNQHGGLQDVNNARRNPPSHLRPASWNQLIDRIFLNRQWQHRARRNSENRAKLPYCSFHGSRSYVSSRFKKMNPETRKIQGPIKNWYDMHYKPTKGWVNEQAKADYEKLVAELESQTQNATSSSNPDGSSSSNPDGSSSINEQEIFKKVFGERRGHNVGLGRKLKRPSGLPSSSTTSTPASNEMQYMIRAAQKAWERHHEEQERKRYQDLAAYFSSMIPNSNIANLPPFVSTPAPPFDYNAYKENQPSSSQSQDDDDDDDDDEDSHANEED